jgi:secondary thiamine-phosphate synthase enzyme
MTSIEVPYSIAAALPTLSVMDVTNDVAQTVARSGRQEGIAYIHVAHSRSLVRIQERETGFFEDLEGLLERIVPTDVPNTGNRRERLVAALLSPRSEQVPFRDGSLCLGRWQRILLFSLDAEHRNDWSLTLLG